MIENVWSRTLAPKRMTGQLSPSACQAPDPHHSNVDKHIEIVEFLKIEIRLCLQTESE